MNSCVLERPNSLVIYIAKDLGLSSVISLIRGEIEEVWFKHPHVRYLLQVKDKKNKIEIWDLRGSPVVWLARKGWTKDRIKKGDEITVSGYPGHDGKKMLSIIEVKLSDGTILIDKAPK